MLHASTGHPIQIFRPTGGHPKIERFISLLSREARVGRFPDEPATGTYPPINSTADIAAAVSTAWEKLREGG